MKLPTPYEMLLERLAPLDPQIETPQAGLAGDRERGADRALHGTERTLETLLASRTACAQRLSQVEREELSCGRRDVWALADDARERFARLSAREFDAMSQLLHVGEVCARRDVAGETCLLAVLDAAIRLTGAAKGNVQLRDGALLRIAAQRNFDAPFLRFFAVVSADEPASCGRALQTRARVLVRDVAASSIFAGQPAQRVLLDAGVRAVTSLPLVAGGGDVVGMLSVHFATPHAPDDRTLSLLDLLGRLAADYLERTRVQHDLEMAEEDLRQTFENAAIGLTRCSRDLRYVAANQACARIVGLPVERIVGQRIVDVIGVDAFERIRPRVERVLAGERVEYEDEIPYASDGSRWVHVVYEPWKKGDEVVGWLASISDVTAHRNAKEELTNANRRKDEFLATLAHELRNPLAPIRTGAELLRRVGSPSQTRVLDVIDRQVTQLMRLVNELMEVSRITRGTVELQRELLDLGAVLRTAVETAAPALQASRTSVDLSVPPEGVWVDGDALRLGQVFTNLLDNAAKYADAGGRVVVVIAREAGEAVVRVRDGGIGIAADMLKRIFDLFTQVDRAPGRTQAGLGIGLALVKSLVELHGGRVEARSEGPGCGSEFEVRLPLAHAPRAARSRFTASADTGAARPLAGHRVLVVDDNRDAADTMVQLLMHLAAEARAAYSGIQALDALPALRPSVVFLDLGMPGMDGYEVARLIRGDPAHASVRLVALTGWGQEHDVRRTREAGFEQHLVKPADPDALLSVLLDS
jgi:PAS domain S-box-containing protein